MQCMLNIKMLFACPWARAGTDRRSDRSTESVIDQRACADRRSDRSNESVIESSARDIRRTIMDLQQTMVDNGWTKGQYTLIFISTPFFWLSLGVLKKFLISGSNVLR